jgi:hypothetical protein
VDDKILRFEARYVESRSTTSAKKGTRCTVSFDVDLATHDALMAYGSELENKVFAVGMVLVDYDNVETAVTSEKRVEKTGKKRHIGEIEMKTFELCRDDDFRRFVVEAEKLTGVLMVSTDQAADYIKYRCGVAHRSEIEQNRTSATMFGKMLVQFEKWRDDDNRPVF